MALSARDAFKQTLLETDETIYTLIKLPANAIWAAAGILAQVNEAFSVVIADAHEITLILPAGTREEFANRLPDAQEAGEYRLITFTLELDLALVGFMAIVAETLAAAQVPIMAFSAFSRDHLLVPADQFQRAWDVLRAAQAH